MQKLLEYNKLNSRSPLKYFFPIHDPQDSDLYIQFDYRILILLNSYGLNFLTNL